MDADSLEVFLPYMRLLVGVLMLPFLPIFVLGAASFWCYRKIIKIAEY